MGEPKQLLLIDDSPLLDWQMKKWVDLPVCETFIVIGAYAPLVLVEVIADQAKWVLNENWRKGMGSSIQAGLKSAMETIDGLSGCLIVLHDQVNIDLGHLNLILEKAESNPGFIVASSYAGQLGVPAFFPASFFDDLESIEPGHGAGTLIRRKKEKVVSLNLPEAEFDLDTQEDYLQFLKIHAETNAGTKNPT